MGLPAGAWIDWRYRDPGPAGAATPTRCARSAAIAIANHPWAPTPGSLWGFGFDFPQVDAIEIWNGPWTLDDQVGVAAWHAMLLAGKFKPGRRATPTATTPARPSAQAQTVVHAETLSTPRGHGRRPRAAASWLAESSAVDLTFEASLRGTTVELRRAAAGPAASTWSTYASR